MALAANVFESQDNILSSPSPLPLTTASKHTPIPDNLQRATFRLEFPPSYVVVGVYRLLTDKGLWEPAWAKCAHAVQRGAIVGSVWAFATFSIQKKFIELFLSNSPRVTGLSHESMFGLKVPFNVYTYATIMLVGTQLTFMLRFFLSRNLRIARERVWAQTVASRGKAPDFFQPYVEEWSIPPTVQKESWIERAGKGWVSAFFIRQVLLAPFKVYPLVGMLASAWFKALSTSKYLHRRYFEAKKMTKDEVAVFMEERKWDYRAFGFTAALLEGIPIIGLVFEVSNRIGAAMWAYDLEKRQHFVAEQKAAGKWTGLEMRSHLQSK